MYTKKKKSLHKYVTFYECHPIIYTRVHDDAMQLYKAFKDNVEFLSFSLLYFDIKF